MSNANTKLLMTISSIVFGLIGLSFTFLPSEILKYINLENTKALQLLLQILGALYLSLGILNWMSKASVIGGIYNRPILMANLIHLIVAGLAIIKALISYQNLSLVFLIIAVIYSVFGILFGLLLFKAPLPKKET